MKGKKVKWTAADKARHRAIRAKFQAEQPAMEELLASGDYIGPLSLEQVLAMKRTLAQLKVIRKKVGLSLSDVARLTGMDKAAISRLENGHQANPTYETLCRYAGAIGRPVIVQLEDEATKLIIRTTANTRKKTRED